MDGQFAVFFFVTVDVPERRSVDPSSVSIDPLVAALTFAIPGLWNVVLLVYVRHQLVDRLRIALYNTLYASNLHFYRRMFLEQRKMRQFVDILHILHTRRSIHRSFWIPCPPFIQVSEIGTETVRLPDGESYLSFIIYIFASDLAKTGFP